MREREAKEWLHSERQGLVGTVFFLFILLFLSLTIQVYVKVEKDKKKEKRSQINARIGSIFLSLVSLFYLF